ncbi:MAG: leucine-rich repeat domain-containing protein [Mycoplasmataceae bacterium]|nr:leucine-rich repeat domain-containing protein [Mycoplasmataceae bacterium]
MTNKSKSTSQLASDKKLSVIYRMWKRHKRSIALVTTLGCLMATGIGVGVGYIIWHNKNSTRADHTYTLERTAKVLDWNRNAPLSTQFTMKKDGAAIESDDVMLSINTGNDYVTINNDTNTITYDKTKADTLAIDVTATSNGHTASTYIVLDDFNPTNVLTQDDPAWVNLFPTNKTSGVLNGQDIDKTTTWLQTQNQYDTVDLSSFSSVGVIAFAGCASLNSDIGAKDITISFENFVSQTGTTSIDEGAFANCTGIKNLILPKATAESNVFSIGIGAFENCENLEKVSLPNGTSTANISIGNIAFYNCTSLDDFALPNGIITSIGVSSFGDCINLKTLSLSLDSSDTLITCIEGDAFCNCKSLSISGIQALQNKINTENLAYVSNNTTGAAIVAVPTKEWIDGAGLLSGNIGQQFNDDYFKVVNSISNHAFEGCASLTNIDLSTANASGSIGDNAFSGCTNLENISTPLGVVSINDNAFENCAKLSTLHWYNENNPTSIGNNAFLGCPTGANNNLYFRGTYGSSWEVSQIPNRPIDWTYTAF